MRGFVGIFGIVLMLAGPALADPKVSETIKHYTIKGDTAVGLKAQMAQKGPDGFWGYSNWWVSWDGLCNVKVDITITMPKLAKNSGAPDALKEEFDRMYGVLLAHERQHGQHGIEAAKEVMAANCENTDPIFAKWQKADRDYDRRTKHGKTEGVVLR
ncbi:MAG: DUF922 domain-containing protein [Pseudomonadota bacterium]